MNPLLLALAKPLFALTAGSAVFWTKSSVELQKAEAAFEAKKAEIEQVERELLAPERDAAAGIDEVQIEPKPRPKIDEVQIVPKPAPKIEDVKELPKD